MTGAPDEQPLYGVGILVTREATQAGELSDALTALGANITELPVLEFRSPADSSALDAAVGRIGEYDWILFASSNAVDFFAARLAGTTHDCGSDVPSKTRATLAHSLASVRIAAIGAKTADHVKQVFGREANFIPSQFIAENFVEEFAAKHDAKGLKIIWPRSDKGRMLIKEDLEKAGAKVDLVVAYESCRPASSPKRRTVMKQLDGYMLSYVTLTSSEAARNFADIIFDGLDAQQRARVLDSVAICSIGNQTSKTIRELFPNRVIQPEEFTIQAMVACIVDDVKNKSQSR